MLGKRGFELQFNWIFVLIAGAIILMFFFLVLRNQINSSEVSQATQVQDDIEFLFRGSQGSRVSEKVVPIHGSLLFECGGGVSSYSVEGSPASTQYNYLAVFSPPLLTGSEMLLMTDYFRAPFHVMPFTYATDSDVEYIFVGDDLDMRKLFASFPANATKTLLTVPLESFPDNSYSQVVILAEAEAFQRDVLPHRLLQFKEERLGSVRAVAFEADGGIAGSFGTIDFFDYTSSGFEKKERSYYFTFEQLLGAAISGDGGIYSCQFEKSASRVGMVSELHRARISQMLLSPKIESSCYSQYTSVLGYLDEMAQIVKNKVDATQLDALFQDIQAIKILNNAIVSGTNCPPIY